MPCKVYRTKTHDSEKVKNKARGGGESTLHVKGKQPEKHPKKNMLKGVKAKRQRSGNEERCSKRQKTAETAIYGDGDQSTMRLQETLERRF